MALQGMFTVSIMDFTTGTCVMEMEDNLGTDEAFRTLASWMSDRILVEHRRPVRGRDWWVSVTRQPRPGERTGQCPVVLAYQYDRRTHLGTLQDDRPTRAVQILARKLDKYTAERAPRTNGRTN